MNLKKWLHTDEISVGVILGLVLPVIASFLFLVILRLVQNFFHILNEIHDIKMLLLGMAVNLIAMRYYLINLKLLKTGKALLALTVFMIVIFFIFLRNSTFVAPF
jgi:hypothetical protein